MTRTRRGTTGRSLFLYGGLAHAPPPTTASKPISARGSLLGRGAIIGPPTASVTPAVLGEPHLGSVLGVDVGSWTSATPLAFSLQWQRCGSLGEGCVDIRGATSPLYQVTFDDARPGQTVRVKVTAWSISGGATAASPPSTQVAGDPPLSIKPPALSGDAKDGGSLRVDRGSWASSEPYSLSYQWLRCDSAGGSCENVAGATAVSYLPGPLDVGRSLRAVVRASDLTGATDASTSISAVVAAAAPKAADPPRIAGDPTSGEPLTVISDLWFGTPPFQFSYQWLRCDAAGVVCAAIVGANGQTYTPTALDLGAGSIEAQVMATNAGGSGTSTSGPVATSVSAGAATATSGAVAGGVRIGSADVTAPSSGAIRSDGLLPSGGKRLLTGCTSNPVNTALPTTSPSSSVHAGGSISIASSGTWSPPSGTCVNQRFRYAWFRDSGLVVDQGTSTSPYTTGSADIGHNLQLQVTYEYGSSDQYGASARSGNVTVTNSAPNTPDAQSPPDGAVDYYVPGNSATQPSFTARFSDPDGDSGYLNWDIQQWNGSSYVEWQSSQGSGVVCNTCWGTFFPNTMRSGAYAWAVSPQDQWGAGGSGIGYFGLHVYEAPSVPNLSFPGSGTPTVPNPTPDLKASATDAENDPVYYRFQVATDSNFSTGSGGSLVGDFAWMDSGVCNIPSSWTDPLDATKTQSLKHGQTYWWRAASADQDGQSLWSTARSFTVAALPNLGASGNWPFFSSGPLAVNETTGNLVLAAPSPSFPTSAGTLGLSITYNSHDTGSRGLGTGWTIGQDGAIRLIDHTATASDGSDQIERVLPDGSSVFYQHVDGTPSYLPTDGSDAHLTKNPDNTYTLLDTDGSVYTFSSADSTTGVAYPTNIQSLSAQAGVGEIDYAYVSGDSLHRLASVTAKDGTSTVGALTLTWGTGTCTSALLCVSGPDGVVWKYVGDGSGTPDRQRRQPRHLQGHVRRKQPPAVPLQRRRSFRPKRFARPEPQPRLQLGTRPARQLRQLEPRQLGRPRTHQRTNTLDINLVVRLPPRYQRRHEDRRDRERARHQRYPRLPGSRYPARNRGVHHDLAALPAGGRYMRRA
jgi:hypothetical protein